MSRACNYNVMDIHNLVAEGFWQ